MKALFAAIYSKFVGSELEPLILGGMHNTISPEGEIFPIVVFQVVSAIPDWTFSEDFENILLQFNIFDKAQSPLGICNDYEALVALYDDCVLLVSGWENISMQREDHNLARDEENGVWQYSIQYRILLEKERS